MNDRNTQRIPLQISNDCLVASVQLELTETVLQQFRDDLLERLESSAATGVILDLSGVLVIDLEDFNALRTTIKMVSLMGAIVVVCGLRPGVVSSLIELGAHIDGINAALNLDAAFRLFENLRRESQG